MGLGDVGLGDVRLGNVRLGYVGREDSGTWDSGTWDSGTWDSGTWDARIRGRAKTRGRDKQTTPDICAEFVEYNFLRNCGSFLILF